jgi:hypothetical protein
VCVCVDVREVHVMLFFLRILFVYLPGALSGFPADDFGVCIHTRIGRFASRSSVPLLYTFPSSSLRHWRLRALAVSTEAVFLIIQVTP